MEIPKVTVAEKTQRSTVGFLLSLSLFCSAIVQALLAIAEVPGTVLAINISEAGMILNIAGGIIALLYWSVNRPVYESGIRPVGVTILAVQNFVAGAILFGTGFALSIFGIPVALLGLGFLYLGRSLWKGKDWSLSIMQVLTVIDIVAFTVLLVAFRSGNPLLAIFQLWYLRRPHVPNFFNPPVTTFDDLPGRNPLTANVRDQVG